ncbi:MAG: type II toxin-antitoxin system VapC family toxin [Actinobacteria bacterium]|nr:type II toxin-antitoxin system VapC family toxin [Actinomycetota bacterium]
MIYLDTSAAVKTLFAESDSESIRALFTEEQPFVSSRVFALEVHSAAARRGVPEERAVELVSRVTLITLDDSVMDAAIAGGSGLRTLDTLHLATALRLEGLVDAMLSFDRELLDRAREAGISPHPLCA